MKINGLDFECPTMGGLEVIRIGEEQRPSTCINFDKLIELYDNNMLDFDCRINGIKIQRDLLPTGKGSSKKYDNNDLIHSCIYNYDIGRPILIFIDGEWKVFEGQQRLKNIINYFKNLYAFDTSKTEEINTILKTYDLKDKKKFEDLPDELQSDLRNKEIIIDILEVSDVERLLIQFPKTNSGKAVTKTEITACMLGEDITKFELLEKTDFIENVLKNITRTRRNITDFVIRCSFMAHNGDDYAMTTSKRDSYVEYIRNEKNKQSVNEIIARTNEILDYMALAFDTKEYYSTKPINNNKNNPINFLGRAKTHSFTLFACAMQAMEKNVTPHEFFKFAEEVFITNGKDILKSNKRSVTDYVYDYWHNVDNTASNNSIYNSLIKCLNKYLLEQRILKEMNVSEDVPKVAEA